MNAIGGCPILKSYNALSFVGESAHLLEPGYVGNQDTLGSDHRADSGLYTVP